MPDELSPFAVELIKRCPALINRFAEKINSMIYNWSPEDTERVEVLEPIEIQHVGYSQAECGYDK